MSLRYRNRSVPLCPPSPVLLTQDALRGGESAVKMESLCGCPSSVFSPCWSAWGIRPCLAGSPGGVTQWVSSSPPTPDPDPMLCTPGSRPPGGPCGLPHVGGWTLPSAGVFKALLSPFLQPRVVSSSYPKLVFSAGRRPSPSCLLGLCPLQAWRSPGPPGDTSSWAPWALAGTRCLPARGAAAFLITG